MSKPGKDVDQSSEGEGENRVDVYIGRRLRRRRRLLALTQNALGATTGLTFQQIQKYECGASRMTAARLHTIATALRVPVDYFFEGAFGMGEPRANELAQSDLLDSREAHELLEAFRKLSEPARRRLLALMRTLGETAGGSE
jgi:transcriptional regulator with XRE-family HTH domain